MAHLSEPIELDLTDEQAFIVSVFIREGELRERERIIALLEELRSEFRARTEPDNSDVVNMCIALIKGETE